VKKSLIRIGTRGSPLALVQSNWVKASLTRHFPDLQVDVVAIKTKGDKILDVPLAKIGGKGLFVKEIEEALLQKKIDLAVHSMKDLPGELPAGLVLGAIPLREDPRDVFISRAGLPFQKIPFGEKIGTSSLRRKAQLLHQRPDLDIVPLRGNLDTRMRKIQSEGLEGIVLAAAGINRMGFQKWVTQVLDLETSLPAVGQGALALEVRETDNPARELISHLNHPGTASCIEAERAFLKRLQGGCQVPLAGHARLWNGRLVMTGLIASLDGAVLLKEEISAGPDDPARLGIVLAEKLLDRGGREILEEVYGQQGLEIH
jgi:hydroxymethylbilane synthase